MVGTVTRPLLIPALLLLSLQACADVRCHAVRIYGGFDPANPDHAGSCDAVHRFDWWGGHKLPGEK
jgi:hypothetical protein